MNPSASHAASRLRPRDPPPARRPAALSSTHAPADVTVNAGRRQIPQPGARRFDRSAIGRQHRIGVTDRRHRRQDVRRLSDLERNSVGVVEPYRIAASIPGGADDAKTVVARHRRDARRGVAPYQRRTAASWSLPRPGPFIQHPEEIALVPHRSRVRHRPAPRRSRN